MSGQLGNHPPHCFSTCFYVGQPPIKLGLNTVFKLLKVLLKSMGTRYQNSDLTGLLINAFQWNQDGIL